jgi:hypothetical protein
MKRTEYGNGKCLGNEAAAIEPSEFPRIVRSVEIEHIEEDLQLGGYRRVRNKGIRDFESSFR